ncbi:transporter substrate-binding domain-containing protein [Pantoea sp. LS15]|uniref:response regulator n=1 Tax=Enterobacterales TaxID=91347 RepID=UPI000E0F1029|nr:MULTISPECIES: transporter substrate-binding domain-containing protein [Enterobacterales]NJQ21109.1 transporter substrate-binding domain-containing protein [Pantoea sp. LS15]NKF47705.1 transporter substrate-binding domain-containing protein [Pantoea sp. LS15]RDK13521.1 response regulator [Enterobacter sp. 9-2]
MRFLSARLISLFFTVFFVWQLPAQELVLQPRVQVNAPHVQFSDEAQRWLSNNPTLHVGVWGQEHPPLSEGMGHGVFSGIAADYLALLEDSLKVKIKLHYYDQSHDALAALQRHEIQMVAIWNPELWPSPDLQATPPWLLDKAVLMTSKPQGEAPLDLRNKVLGLVAGSHAGDALRRYYPESTLRYQTWYTTAVSALAFKQLDALWINRASAEYLTQYHQARGLSWTFSPAIPNLNMSFGVDRQLPLLAEAIDTVFKHIPLASRLRIAINWGLNRSFVITSNPLGLDQEEENWLREHGDIKVIIDQRQRPISFVSEGESAGLVVDLLNQFHEQYGIRFTVMPAENDTEMLALKRAYPDALFVEQVIDTPQQTKDGTAKTPPLLTTPAVVVMDQDIKRPDDFTQLKGEKIAIQASDPLIPWLETWYPTIKLVMVPHMDDALERLKNGEVRGVIAPQFIANYLVTLHHPTRFHLAVTLPVTPVDLVLSAQTGHSQPVNIINKALADMQPQALMQMAGNWRQAAIENSETWDKSTLLNSLVWGVLLLLVVLGCWLWIQYLRAALRRGNVWQQKLAEQLTFTQALIDASPVALYVRDRQGNLLRYNQAWSEAIGQSGQELIGLPITAINTIEPFELAAIEAKYNQALQDGLPQKWSVRFQTDGRSRYLQGWVVPWHDSQGEVGGLIGGWLDITEKEQLITQLSETKSNLEQAIASKNAFMQSMGHEVRTPLSVITGLLEMELQGLDARHEHNENLNLIWESSLNLLSLIGDMFDVFRADNPQLNGTTRSTHLPQLIDSTVALYRQQAEAKGITLNVLIELSTERFTTDPLLIIRILSSLLRNAIKHSECQEIDVEVYEGSRDPDASTIPLVIEVCDQGKGIDGEMLEQITRRAHHVTLKSEWTDTGFSLPACLHMAHAAGAQVRIDSEPHEGCVVSLHFNAVPATSKVLTPPPVEQARSLHILGVDDYPPARRALQQRLESWGHQVSLATQGAEALSMWQQNPGRYDVIITDCTMPEMDGYELAQQIRHTEQLNGQPPIPIFGLTAMSGTETAARCLEAGMNEYLEKPLTAEKLQALLERYFSVSSVKPALGSDTTQTLHAEMVEVNRQDASKLTQWLEQKNRDKVGRMAHRINGGARMMNMAALQKACEQLETACHDEGSWQEIEILVERVQEEMTRFNQQLSSESGETL